MVLVRFGQVSAARYSSTVKKFSDDQTWENSILDTPFLSSLSSQRLWGKIGQSLCDAVLLSLGKTSNSSYMTIELTYQNIFVTNIVLHQLRMISKGFIQVTLIILTSIQLKLLLQIFLCATKLDLNRHIQCTVVSKAKICLTLGIFYKYLGNG